MATKQQQIKDVTQGLALGIISLGVDVEFRSMAEFESAFETPWRKWSGSAAYPSLGGHRFGRDIYFAAGKSAGWRSAVAARWEGPPMRPVEEHPDWSPEECADLISGGAVTAKQWQELAQAVVARTSH